MGTKSWQDSKMDSIGGNKVPPSSLLISLDVELQWGFYDLPYRLTPAEVRNIPQVIEEMLGLFQQHHVKATWAVVGALACPDAPTLIEELTTIPFQYQRESCHPLGIREEIGAALVGFVAPGIVEKLRKAPEQEIACHTFSHFYAQELPFYEEAFRKDLELCKKWLPEAKTLIFPRNQHFPRAVEIAQEAGLPIVRSNPSHWLYRVNSSRKDGHLKRIMRLADHYFPLAGHHFVHQKGPEISYSRFFRPIQPISYLEHRKVDRICQSLSVAAVTGNSYHLWWHPHNFAKYPKESLKQLDHILSHYHFLHETHGMQSHTLHDFYQLSHAALPV
ncbi:hypothetical protein ACFO0S_08680 [Chryseomicrobium palamuruense]|uniref:NodB homology domain-containing protein n=1 Tax=Chryseomicrobium palamuruense TaxID=682973 RepID=A0ABV8UXE7_9BACL